jgi:hypothetical protein
MVRRVGEVPDLPIWPGTRAAGPVIRKVTVQRFPYARRVHAAEWVIRRVVFHWWHKSAAASAQTGNLKVDLDLVQKMN